MFAIGCVKGCSKDVSSVVAPAKYCSLTPCRFHPFSKHPSGHHSLFSVHVLFPQGFFGVHSRVLFTTRTLNSHNHSYVHYSLPKFTGEWFTNRTNHIQIFTPITRIVATKVGFKSKHNFFLRRFLRGKYGQKMPKSPNIFWWGGGLPREGGGGQKVRYVSTSARLRI